MASYADQHKLPSSVGPQSVHRAPDTRGSPIEDMGLDQGGLHVTLAQVFPDRSNIVAVSE